MMMKQSPHDDKRLFPQTDFMGAGLTPRLLEAPHTAILPGARHQQLRTSD